MPLAELWKEIDRFEEFLPRKLRLSEPRYLKWIRAALLSAKEKLIEICDSVRHSRKFVGAIGSS